ncbi:TonB-dependent receptor [Hymenobacter chitinivorans]|uniref:TonB-dependent receptor n=1 Tax=Hymenobacter chitinivorans DSM 11115 TaxID=1121954 RepID=A0A2M9B983_9BACT|nr:TonB-dependent receptor [Hymenobacter chitinivorans]PJJ54498.1 TonB-dependent receptor [Hymenobacter chitinivorans DSM 11115]
MRRLGLLFIFLIISSFAFAQQGVISGKVTDKKTGDGVIGATVLVTGTVQAAPVDVQGNYELKLDPGTYNITMTYIGYKPLTFAGIVVTANGKTTLNGVMEENTTNLKEVTVTGQKQTGTEVAMIQDLKKSEVVVSGMSNDQIVKTLDRDAAEVVKRIPGVTVQNNNFIVIRGLAERYNTVMLNDALTPSAETDTRSFAFDILPSSVIDRVLIFKSGSPELPGEFGGGVVKVYTKNSVLDNTGSLSISGWARSTNTFAGRFQQSNHSGTDFLGFDNSQRALPGTLAGLTRETPTTTPTQLQELRGSLRNEFLPTLTNSRPDLRISLGINHKFEIGGVYISNVTSLSYSNTQEQYNALRQRFTAYNPTMPDQLPGKFFEYNDTRSLSAVRLGIIHNYQVRLNDRNKLEFRNFFNQYGTDEVVNRKGQNLENSDPLERNDYSLHYQSRSIYSGQLGGNHVVGPASRTTLTWATGYNYVYRDEPDYRQNQQEREYVANKPGEMNPEPFRVVINSLPTTSSRFYASLRENTYMGSGQVERSYRGRDTLSANQYKVRLGFYLEEKERTYDSRYFNYTRARNFDYENIGNQPLSTIFSNENLDPKTGFVLKENTLPQDRYTGKNRLAAGYLSGVAPISDHFSVTGGVRVEYNDKSLQSGDTGTDQYRETRTFVLPSLNATYTINERHLVRAGVSESVNRPEFREVADYTYYDFSNNFFVRGNDSLRTARIYNADLRYEFYPSRSEMISVGIFGKRFTNAIEQVTRSTTGSDLTLTYQNASKAYDVGVEVEARKSLLDLTENHFLQRLSFVVNASLIRSRVQIDTTLANNRNFALTNRPLQGQSPYVVNLGVFYQDDENHWQISAQYNIVGPRIAFLGDQNQNFSVIELPRNVVDLGLTKGFGSHFEVRAGIQNVLNQEVRQYYDFDRNSKINGIENGAAFARYRRGTYSTLGATFRF